MDDHLSHHQIDVEIGDNAHIVAAGDNITQTVNIAHNYSETPSATASSAVTDAAEIEARYRAQVVAHYNHLALTGLSEKAKLPELALEDIFIMLDVEIVQPKTPTVVDCRSADGFVKSKRINDSELGKYDRQIQTETLVRRK